MPVRWGGSSSLKIQFCRRGWSYGQVLPGFPVGYVIARKYPNVRLKDGTLSASKKVLIDGQQRVTALAAIVQANLMAPYGLRWWAADQLLAIARRIGVT
mgnify:CR=1 FL=1